MHAVYMPLYFSPALFFVLSSLFLLVCCCCRRFFFFVFFSDATSLIVCEKFGSHSWVRLQQPQEQRYPFQPLCAVFSWVQTMVWLPVFGSLTCTEMLMQGIGHRGCTNTVTESALKGDWEKTRLPHRGIEPASVLRLVFSIRCSANRAMSLSWETKTNPSLTSVHRCIPTGSSSRRGQRCMQPQGAWLDVFEDRVEILTAILFSLPPISKWWHSPLSPTTWRLKGMSGN